MNFRKKYLIGPLFLLYNMISNSNFVPPLVFWEKWIMFFFFKIYLTSLFHLLFTEIFCTEGHRNFCTEVVLQKFLWPSVQKISVKRRWNKQIHENYYKSRFYGLKAKKLLKVHCKCLQGVYGEISHYVVAGKSCINYGETMYVD